MMEMLRGFPLFKDLTDSELISIKALLRMNSYKKGEHVFFHEDPLKCIYFIEHGSVKIYKNDINGKEQIVNVLTRGEMFPHQGFFQRSYYPANAIAMEQVKLFYLPIQSFEALLLEQPSLSVKLIYMLGNLIVDLHNRLEEQILHSSFEQIVMLLLRLSEKHGVASDSQWITLNQFFSNQEMANMIGASRETISRTMSQLKKKDAIKKENTGYLSIQPEKLYQLFFIE